METNNSAFPVLFNLLESKMDAFKDFLCVTMSLKDFSESNDMDQIGKLLKKCDHYINVIDRIDRKIETMKDNNSPRASTLSDVEKEKIRIIIKSIEKTAKKAGLLNKEIETTLTNYHNTLKKRLLTTNHSRDGVKRYVLKEYGKNQPRFLDTKF
ncbi:MAG: hypothetical protein JXC33_08165 [Deltaproteobacteria bacterium]|nr:hypothetical protein [Deltaproteobacteria bacterium]